MKKIIFFFILILTIFLLFGCTQTNTENNNLKPTNNITEITPNNDNNNPTTQDNNNPTTQNNNNPIHTTNNPTLNPDQNDNQNFFENIENGVLGVSYNINSGKDKYTITLTDVETATSLYPSPDANYLMANFTIKNVGTTTFNIFPIMYFVDSQQEKNYMTFIWGDEKYSKHIDYFEELLPNTEISGWFSIELLNNTKFGNLYFEHSTNFETLHQYIKYEIKDIN
jgi:hypothetical protein